MPEPSSSISALSSGSSTPTQREQCWECRRRRLVCDGGQPVCAKCRTARIVCPGYADKKPLTWLAPGQIKSRARRRNPAVKGQRPPKQGKTTPPSDAISEDADSTPAKEELELGMPVELRPEICDIFDAMLYYNTRIYPDMIRNQLAPSRYVLPLRMVQHLPPSITHTLVSIFLSHRIIQVADNPASDALVKPLWTRMYHHRDIAIRSINKLVGEEASRKDVVTIIAVYTLLFAILQQSFTPSWRIHMSGFLSLVHLRGSFTEVIRDTPEMELSLIAICIVGTFANTTSPRHNLFHVAPTPSLLSLLSTFYTETYFPSLPCPPPLLPLIIHTTALRTAAPSPTTTSATLRLLAEIDAFSPQTWSSSTYPSQPDWLLLASTFHAATALYALLALHSSGALPPSSPTGWARARTRHATALGALLASAMAAPRVRRRMVWPL
ncbi:hypothetical protein C8A05DRAFT_20156, partial [Staphylotrichum tortipilum]